MQIPTSGLSDNNIRVILQTPGIPQELKDSLRYFIALESFITVDPRMMEVKERVKVLHSRNESVLILGESGTGKELLATALHGGRKGKFIKVNCSGLPAELIESELFGHTKGAFTGAITDRKGKFVEAKDGTIFLDEIGDMPLPMQAKLLRALQEKEVTPLGSNDPIAINCRIVSATHQVERIVAQKEFRLDLLHRVSTFTLHTIPLRERVQDIHEMIDALYDKTHAIPTDIRNAIAALPLLGNVRELEARCLRYIVFKDFNKDSYV